VDFLVQREQEKKQAEHYTHRHHIIQKEVKIKPSILEQNIYKHRTGKLDAERERELDDLPSIWMRQEIV
jgi:hypothetical protein